MYEVVELVCTCDQESCAKLVPQMRYLVTNSNCRFTLDFTQGLRDYLERVKLNQVVELFT